MVLFIENFVVHVNFRGVNMKYDITRVTTRTLMFSIFISLFTLFIYVLFFDVYKHVKLSEINMNLVGEKVEACGYVNDVYSTPKYTSFYLSDGLNSSIYVIFFKKDVYVSSHAFVCVRGSIKLYNRKLEILGETLR